jgi:hypothetical protein
VELRIPLSGLERLSPTKMKSPICSTNWACPALGSDQSGSFLRFQSTPEKFVAAFKSMSLTEMLSRLSERGFALLQPSKASTRNISLGAKQLLIV